MPSQSDLYRPIGAGKLSDQVARAIERGILEGDLEVGERLPTEDELGRRFAVSRTVIRDAIRTLAARGLVSVRQGHGMVVSPPNEDAFGEALILLLLRSDLTIGDVARARAIIEVGMIPIAARNRTEEDLTEIEAHLARFAESVEAGRWEAAEQAHLAFHLSLLSAMHLPALDLILRPMHEIILLSSRPPTFDDRDLWDVPAHGPILEALVDQNEAAATRATDAHFRFLTDPRYVGLYSRPFRESGPLLT